MFWSRLGKVFEGYNQICNFLIGVYEQERCVRLKLMFSVENVFENVSCFEQTTLKLMCNKISGMLKIESNDFVMIVWWSLSLSDADMPSKMGRVYNKFSITSFVGYCCELCLYTYIINALWFHVVPRSSDNNLWCLLCFRCFVLYGEGLYSDLWVLQAQGHIETISLSFFVK
jgi:hypothetical protein